MKIKHEYIFWVIGFCMGVAFVRLVYSLSLLISALF